MKLALLLFCVSMDAILTVAIAIDGGMRRLKLSRKKRHYGREVQSPR